MLDFIAVFKDNNARVKELKLNWRMVNDIPVTKVSFASMGANLLYEFRQTVNDNGAEVELVVNIDRVTELKPIK